MNRFATPGTLAALVVANAALALALFTAASPSRQAHAAGIGGGPSYVLNVGRGSGINQEIVYLVDTDSGKAAAVSVNPGLKRIDLYGSRDISKDLNGKAAAPTPK